MSENQPWSASSLGKDAPADLAFFQESLPVRLISTPRSEFRTCQPDDDVAAVVERFRPERFDFIPVVEGQEERDARVVGVLEIATAATKAHQAVTATMLPLAEERLIGADASILTFIRDADRHSFRFVVSGHQISGLVTLSDLQKLSVRAALFAMVTHLEMIVARVIRRRLPRREDWIGLLSPERAQLIAEELAKTELQDNIVDELLFTQFGDKVTLIKKSWPFPAGFESSKTAFVDEMRRIQNLRDQLVHANEYAATSEQARQLCHFVRRMDYWVKELSK